LLYGEKEELQRILAESFDTSYPDFDQHQAMENLKRNFEGKVSLCTKCLIAKLHTELDQYENYCQECYRNLHPIVEIYEPSLQIQIPTPL
jgi:hypothetical protein